MRLKTILAVIAVLLELLIAFSPYLPFLKNNFPANPTPSDQLEFLVTATGLAFAITTALFAVNMILEQREASDFRDEVRELLPPSRAELLRDDEFLQDFLYHASKAKSTVYISYLSPYRPDNANPQTRRRYYRNMLTLIKKSPDIHFRRIVRNTESNRAWVAELVRQFKNLPNIDVALLDDSMADEMPLALSVQLIDDKYVWFVAIGSHERVDAYRDLFIENPKVGEAMKKYYDRLWARAAVVLKAGRLTPDAKHILGLVDD